MTNKTVYLAFCVKCGVEKRITDHIIRHYLQLETVSSIYCSNCYHENVLPEYLKKIASELLEN